MENKITLEEFKELISKYNNRCEFGKEIFFSDLEADALKSMERAGIFKSDKYVVILIDHRNEPKFNDNVDFRYHVLSKIRYGGYASVGTDFMLSNDETLFDYDEIPEKYRALAIKQSEVNK